LNLLAYVSLVGLAHAAHYYGRFRERERRAAALEAQLAKARLSALQAQLHPHFLFNALNAISTLVERDKAAAQEALASFSELLRLALSQADQPEVPLRQDLEFLRRYVEIQQTRLGDRFHFEEAVAPEILDCLAPPLLLQPLVENAIRHGLELSAAPGCVRVVGRADGSRVVLTVEDNGAGPEPAVGKNNGGAGIGLDNLRARLETLYGPEQKVEFGPRPEGGARTRVEFPLRRSSSTI
jgi:LytS/YehU family sensor histidine kinase